ncbi:DNA internalization-related competence protein ComEC/Rec2 [Bacillus solitudinis]|uniref:DNA internalization-related competence protein ComEC/Rec2 n=1 Tax=Bacillus solitudinis TaxID=2014074 RepID=UPI001D0CEFEE|nr:DNA internalization-related competence protein ComEC/Rec2 [Bacillus solitudinis]
MGLLLVTSAILGLCISIRGPSVMLILMAVLLTGYSVLDRNYSRRNLLLILCAFFIYACIGTWTEHRNQTIHQQGEQRVLGTLESIPKIDGDTFSVRLKATSGELMQVHAYLTSEQERDNLKTLQPGNQCGIIGKLQTPSPPTNFYQFNYQRYLYEKNIHWIVTPNPTSISCQRSKGTVIHRLHSWRNEQIKRIEQRVDPTLSGLMIALIFGERDYIEGEIIDAYQRLGIIHLLAVSGLHVGLILGALFYILIRIGVTRERTMESLMVLLPVYMLVAGGAPSVIRASSMAFIVLFCLRIRWRLQPLFSIYLVFLLYTAFQPYALFQIGFQLSFLSTFGLLISSSIIKRYSLRISQLTAITLIAQLLSLPLILIHFFEWSWISLPLNLVYIPLVSFVILPLTFISYLLLFLPATVNIPLLILETIIQPLHNGLQTIQTQPLFMLIIGQPSIYMVFLYFILVLYMLMKWEKNGFFWWIKPISLFIVYLVLLLSLPSINNQAVITMIDVGQGDSFLIELPYRKKVYLIDTGGLVQFNKEDWRERKNRFDIGKDVVLPYLKARGIRTIDMMMLTHGHTDHIGGASALVGVINVKKILYAKGPVEGPFERELLQQFYEQGTEIEFAKEGLRWRTGTNQFAVLAPQGHEQGLNNQSIVLYAVIEGIRWLFTGDLEEEGEKRLMRQYEDLQVDVLKAGHHGSLTSSNDWFISHINPKAVLISAGRRNRFGHPHPEVVERFSALNSLILRTDQMGAVQLSVRNNQIRLKSVIQQEKQEEPN